MDEICFGFVAAQHGQPVLHFILPTELVGTHFSEVYANGMQEATENRPVDLAPYVGHFISFQVQQPGGAGTASEYHFRLLGYQIATPQLRTMVTNS